MAWEYAKPTRKGASVGTGLVLFGRGILGVLAGLGVLCQGGAFSPALDLLNHATPIFLIAALGLLILELRRAPRAWAMIGLAVLGAACSGLIVGREMLAGLNQPKAEEGPQFVVLTQNVWQANPDPAALARSILAVDADVVVLEEVFGRGRPVAALVAKAYPYHADCTVISQWCSLAIMSKRPIVKWSHHEGAWQPPEWDRLGLVRATIDGGAAGPFEVVGTQLLHPDTHGMAALQATQFLNAVDGVDPRRTVLVGDFNRTAWAYALRKIDLRLPIPRRTHGIATWPARIPGVEGLTSPAPFLPIDQVYAGSDWRVVSIRRAPASSSDHYGLVTTLRFQRR